MITAQEEAEAVSLINLIRGLVVDFALNSAVLKAIAQKLIPGIALTTRISILQQTTFREQERGPPDISGLELDGASTKSDQTALQYVIESDNRRNDYLREVAGPNLMSISFTLVDMSTLTTG